MQRGPHAKPPRPSHSVFWRRFREMGSRGVIFVCAQPAVTSQPCFGWQEAMPGGHGRLRGAAGTHLADDDGCECYMHACW